MTKTGSSEWFDNEAFWRATYPFMFSDTRMTGTEEEMARVLSLTGVRDGAALDLCCGPGRSAIALARRGFAVTGVDLTPFLLDKARRRARREKLPIRWVRSDMREYRSPESFDLAISMFSSIGYFEDREEDFAVLRNVRSSLRPGGKFLLELAGRECIAASHEPTGSTRLPGGDLLVKRREIFDDWTRIRNEWIVVRQGRAETFTFALNLYSGQELKEKMTDAGFSDVVLYGSLAGDGYGAGARRLIAVGTVPR